MSNPTLRQFISSIANIKLGSLTFLFTFGVAIFGAGMVAPTIGDKVVSSIGEKVASIIGKEVASSIGEEVASSIGEEVASIIGEKVVSIIGKEVALLSIGREVASNVDKGVASNIGKGVASNIGEEVASNVDKGVASNVDKGVASNIGKGVASNIGEEVASSIGEEVASSIGEEVASIIGEELTLLSIGREVASSIDKEVASNIGKGVASNIGKGVASNIAESKAPAAFYNFVDFVDQEHPSLLWSLLPGILEENPDGIETYAEAMSSLLWQIKSQDGYARFLSGNEFISVQITRVDDGFSLEWDRGPSVIPNLLDLLPLAAEEATVARLNAEMNLTGVAWLPGSDLIVRGIDGSMTLVRSHPDQ